MTWHDGCAKLIVLIDRAVVESHLSMLLDRHFDHVEFDADVPLTGAVGQAIRAHAMLMQDAAHQSLALPAGMGRLVQRELRNGLVGLLLAGVAHDRSALLAQPVSAPAPGHVKRVEDFCARIRIATSACPSLRRLQAPACALCRMVSGASATSR